MYKIGITGGIGAGKSTVSFIFSILGIPHYNADRRARILMENEESLKDRIKSLLGEEAYREGKLNSSWIADRVFSDPWQLNKLNGIVHPAVEKDYIQWHQDQDGGHYTLKEAALLFDAGSYLKLDATIVVTASEDIRIQRVSVRDGLTVQQVRSRMDQQWPEDRRILMADFIIDNNGQIPLVSQVMKIHEELKA